ncbi:MAG TPA: ADP-glyceromanno-heptose 6-epimerase [Acidiferrobacterales bacterium]|nr:ADP-glyceromanno-heptose 6-epimerase [Acidiferrobacterales bacterium]
MIIVTGGAGFIGANIVKALNHRGINDVMVVDNLERAEKFRNIADCEIVDYLDKHKFLEQITAGDFARTVTAVFHEGACSDTMEHNGAYMMQNNYEYSKSLLHFCQREKIPLLYASSGAVYGSGQVFREARECEAPLNVYGYSKFLFDQYVRRILPHKTAQIAGFRYFNVYGEREQHKARMASVAFHLFNQYRDGGQVRLFQGSGGYPEGEQRRDFISVEDVVAVNLFFFDNADKSGIFNVGTGRSQTFNDVAVAVVNCLRRARNESPLDLKQMQAQGILEYIEFPPGLVGKYQSFTQADVGALRRAGYKKEFLTVEQGVGRYVDSLLKK